MKKRLQTLEFMDIKRITREYWGQSYISEHNLNGIDTSILKNTT